MSDQSRRKLLKSIAAGSSAVIAGKSLPESWTKPVVDSVMLPEEGRNEWVGDYYVNHVFSGYKLDAVWMHRLGNRQEIFE